MRPESEVGVLAMWRPHIPCLLLSVLALSFSCSGGGGDENGDGLPAAPDASGDLMVGDAVAGHDTTRNDGQAGEVWEHGDTFYSITVLLEPGVAITCDDKALVDCFEGLKCCRFQFNRDLTGLETKFAFGSTHIAPAISLAMTDTMYKPVLAFIILNFGIIIGTADKPAATDSSGDYKFTGFEPEIRVEMFNRKYTSKTEGSQGQFKIANWSAEEGGLFAGSFDGTIVQETDKPDKLRAQVKGTFHFILPAPADGQ
jgi:hypothetical protein